MRSPPPSPLPPPSPPSARSHRLLGKTLPRSRGEKAGILKPNVPCFSAPPGGGPPEIIPVAAYVGAPMSPSGRRTSPPVSGPSRFQVTHQRTTPPSQSPWRGHPCSPPRAIARRRRIADGWPAVTLAGSAWSGWGRRPAARLRPQRRGRPGAGRRAARDCRRPPGRLLMSSPRTRTSRGDLAALGPLATALVDHPRRQPARAPRRGALADEAARFISRRAAVAEPTAALVEARRRAAGGLVVVCGSMFLVGPLRAALLGETVDPQRTSDPLSPAPSR